MEGETGPGGGLREDSGALGMEGEAVGLGWGVGSQKGAGSQDIKWGFGLGVWTQGSGQNLGDKRMDIWPEGRALGRREELHR